MHTMRDTYDLITTFEILGHLQKRKEIIDAIVRQTIECAFFIRDYADKRDDCESSMHVIVSSDVGHHSRSCASD
jgi:2-polyprenyl-3-methyl-5-hydroxy-6-metoxy-1,4-benzoquinol methylase